MQWQPEEDDVSRMLKFTTKAKSQKGTRVAYLLDTARVNVSNIFQMTSGVSEIDAFEVGWDLAASPVLPFAQKHSILGLSNRAQLKLSLLVGDATMAGKFSEEGDQQRREEEDAMSALKRSPGRQDTSRRRIGFRR